MLQFQMSTKVNLKSLILWVSMGGGNSQIYAGVAGLVVWKNIFNMIV